MPTLTQNEIPPMTHPMGRYWDQPDMSQVLIDDEYAMMTKCVFDQLKEYSCSQPSGAYEGKAWKSCPSSFNPRLRQGVWFLRWFGCCEDPDKVSNNQREIILVD